LHRVFYISLIATLSFLTSIAFPSFGDGKTVSIDLGYYRDTTQNLTLDEVTLIGSNKFIQSETGELNLGRDKATIWLRMDITFHENVNAEYYIDLDYSLLDYIDFYYQKSSNWECIKTGSQRAFNKRFLDYRFFVFPVNTNLKAQTVYFKIKSENPVNFLLEIKEASSFYKETIAEEIGHGIFIGFLFLVILTNLIFYFSVKDRSFLIYVGYMFFTLCTNLFLTGHIGKYILYNANEWQNKVFIFTFAITLGFSIWFAHEFLNFKKEKVLTKYLYVPFGILLIALAIISPWIDHATINTLLEIITLILMVLVIYSGFYSLRKGHSPAAFYIAAYLSYLIFITPVILLSFNAFERNFFSVYGAELGVVVESILLAIALGYRYNYEKQRDDKEKEKILKKNSLLKKQLQSKLERQVEERTQELNTALNQLSEQKEEIERQKENIEEQNVRLEKMNNNKTRFISILAHDVKGPINSLFSFSELLKNHIDSLSREELIGLGNKLGNHTKNLFSLLENLLQWSRTQTGSIDKNPVTIDIEEVVNENIELAQMVASPKNIEIVFEQTSGTIYADKDMFNTVLRNLIANAVKFSHSGDKIIVKVEMRRDEAVFMVSDNGVGISPKAQEKLFDIAFKHCTPGTKGESGTGLGLKLCREFVVLNGGQIWVESKFNQGSTFYFTFPLAADTVEVSH